MPKDPPVSQDYRPLLPATQAVPSSSTSPPQPPAGTPATTDAARGRQLTVACEGCRRRKSKAGPGETRNIALKRNFRSLENDRAELDELLYLMRSRSEPEAIGILQHFRSEPNASAALKLVRDGELLLQAFRDANDEESTSISARPPRTTSKQDGKSGVAQVTPSDPGPNAYRPERESSQQYAKPNESNSGLTLKREFSSVQGDMDRLLALLHYIHAAPEAEAWNLLWQIRSSHDPFSALRTAQDGDLAMQQYLNSSWTERDNDGYLRILDATAMRQSPIKVPARPWTNIAGDGIISHLVSIFFVQEQQFLMPYVDKKIFLADMASELAVGISE
ncbi:MAG: hypothetical protein LQ351_002377 [Letrouitia transgressa]|nr:MAG: hypothetical protein LQ351_002377 [Letrouitia transgressa]